MSIQLVLNGNDLMIIKNGVIITTLDWHYCDILGHEIETAIAKALGRGSDD